METLVCTDCAAANVNGEGDETTTAYPVGTTFEELPDVVMFPCDSCRGQCFGHPMKVELYEPDAA